MASPPRFLFIYKLSHSSPTKGRGILRDFDKGVVFISRSKWGVINLLILITFTVLLAGSLSLLGFAGSATEPPFNYDPAKIEPGTMYVYQFSTNPEKFEGEEELYFYYLQNSGDVALIEALRRDRKSPVYAYYYNFKLNWDYLMLEKYSLEFLGPREEFPMGSSWKTTANTDFSQQELHITDIHLTKEGKEVRRATYQFDHVPTFFYFILNVDAWTVMRFYPFPKKSIDVWNYTGNKLTGVNVKYQGEERIEVPAGKIRCHKFEMSGKGVLAWLFGKKAWLWMSAEDDRNYMVKYVNNNNRGGQPKVEFRLEEVRKVTQKEWEKKVEK